MVIRSSEVFQTGYPKPTFETLVLTTPLNSCHLSFLLSLSLLPLGQRLFLRQVFVASDTPGPGSCVGPLEVAQVQKMQRDAGYTHALRNDCLWPSAWFSYLEHLWIFFINRGGEESSALS